MAMIAFVAAIAGTGTTISSSPAQDLAYGEYLAGECVSCHAPASAAGGIPVLDGLPADYFIEAMAQYRSGERENAAMRSVVLSLDEEQIKALAAWYEQLDP